MGNFIGYLLLGGIIWALIWAIFRVAKLFEIVANGAAEARDTEISNAEYREWTRSLKTKRSSNREDCVPGLGKPMPADGATFPAQFANAFDLSPREYEFYCAEQFQLFGWDAQVTNQSNDQGVDVIASLSTHNSKGTQIRIVAQCKRHEKPVGNRAVQEIHAGVSLHNAQLGFVIAPNGFTRSAHELADAVGVVLLHHSQISRAVDFFDLG